MNEITGVKPITDTLRSLDFGSFVARASEAQQEIIQAIKDNGGKGKLVITLSYKPRNRTFDIEGDFKATVPTNNKGQTILFADEQGNLIENDPDQRQLFEPATKAQVTRGVSEDGVG